MIQNYEVVTQYDFFCAEKIWKKYRSIENIGQSYDYFFS